MWLVALAAGAPRTIEVGVTDTGGAPAESPVPIEVGPSERVVGGVPVQLGEWDDTAGVVFQDSYVGCTGTLVAPDVVLTAAHCAGGITQVLIGAKNWAFDGDYEFIQVENTIVHPSYNGSSGYDLAALKLRRASRYPPRVIASDCVLDELVDGALVTIVGFGNTQTNGEGGTTQLNQVDTRIVDADCSENRIDGLLTGCDPNLRPGGELGAGGRLDMDGDGAPDGPRDSCFGDSGGPLYLHTERGVFLTGVTSRSFLGVSPDQPCRDGGIYVRPDALIDWIQNRTGTTLPAPQCNEAPQSSIAAARVRPGDSVVGAVVTDDPEGTSWSVELVEQPALGSVTVDGDRVTFTATPGAKGTDIVRFRVTDAGSPVWPRSAPASTEVVWEVSVGGGALACTSSGSAGGLGAWVGLVVLLLHGLGVRVRRS